MNPTSSRIPSSDTRIASSTNPAAPSFSIPLVADPITQSKAGINLTLGAAILASHIPRNVLARGKLVAQTTPESVGGEASDLIDLRKVFAAHAEKNVARNATLQREAKFGPAGWCPVDGSASEPGTSTRHVQCPGPFLGKVDDLAGVQG